VKVRQSGFEATLGLTKVLTGNSRGMLADISVSYPIMASERLMLMPSVGTTWGSKKHNDRYFGITQAQSLESGLPQFNGKRGLIEAKAELGLHYRLSDKWMIGMIGGVSRLVGDVADSPIVERKTRPFGIAFVGYSF
jgi:outer membrane protein